ncbi:conserved hypothetical protein [Pyrobaculum islandicum DSM 4184]|uniref:Uncharacterized protein n=2 Tax=Pyrobaculum islandicum TaxID=2277 RepID=A1RV59_PYRIL|nr:conserved hypothetical protein [Pyrobaculum islandicum DSM 4184]
MRNYVHIKVYRSKNKKYIVIRNTKYKKSIIISLPLSRADKFITKILNNIDKVKKVRIVGIKGTKIKINEKLEGPGWLYFPKHSLVVGVVFIGEIGIVATSAIPSTVALFIPLYLPLVPLFDAEIKDFY